MAANTTPIFPAVVQTVGTVFTSADGTAEKAVFTAGANGARLDGLLATSTDTVAVSFRVVFHDGSTSYQAGVVTVTPGAGTDGVTLPAKVLSSSALPWLDTSGSIFLKAGWSLRLAARAGVAATKAVNFVAFAGDY